MVLKKLYVLLLVSLMSCVGYCGLDITEDAEIAAGDDFGFVNVYSDSVVDVVGGNVGWLSGYDDSVIDISGGSLGNLTAAHTSTFNLYGGEIRQGFQGFHDTATLNVYGHDFSTYIDNGRIFLTGKWQDESTFDFYFYRMLSLPQGVTLLETPEPASILLLLSGILITSFKKRSF